MLKFFLILMACGCVPFVASWRGLILGSGQWVCQNIELCDDPEQYEMKFSISRKKINRTHDCFGIHGILHREINSSYAVKIDVYQLVDGGFKYFQTLADNCACSFLMKHAKENVRRALALANIDPPKCPLKPGPIHISDFVMDYRQLPKHGVYGTFLAIVQFTYAGVTVGCVKCIVNFDEHNGENSEEDDDGIPGLHLL